MLNGITGNPMCDYCESEHCIEMVGNHMLCHICAMAYRLYGLRLG